LIKIEWTPAAIADLEKLDHNIARRIINKISWFADNYQLVTLEPLGHEFKGTYKLRVGDWRIIYTIENEVIIIHFIGHRKDIYEIK
jgi:mRNA interferase RelE/StbE